MNWALNSAWSHFFTEDKDGLNLLYIAKAWAALCSWYVAKSAHSRAKFACSWQTIYNKTNNVACKRHAEGANLDIQLLIQ